MHQAHSDLIQQPPQAFLANPSMATITHSSKSADKMTFLAIFIFMIVHVHWALKSQDPLAFVCPRVYLHGHAMVQTCYMSKNISFQILLGYFSPHPHFCFHSSFFIDNKNHHHHHHIKNSCFFKNLVRNLFASIFPECIRCITTHF